ncbi:MAG: hypothetical protein ACI8WB_006107 [Phenylobacterium sp.]|jgi:hypothetical protein
MMQDLLTAINSSTIGHTAFFGQKKGPPKGSPDTMTHLKPVTNPPTHTARAISQQSRL